MSERGRHVGAEEENEVLTIPPQCVILGKRGREVGDSMLDERYIVAKSKSLVWAKFQDYSPGELKILDTYLSRINPRKPESSLVSFTKKEYAELMGLDSDIRTEQLKTYTGGLLSNVVTIDLPERGYVQYPLFSEAKCYRDDKTGQVTIEVDCNHKLKEAFFDIAQNGYVRYQLKNIISLKSQYSVRLYPKLKDRPFGWTVQVSELREMLGATAASYDVFKDFNKHVLQKAVKEINEITDITVETENIRKGRSVVAIKFKVEEKKQILLDKEQADLYEEEEQLALDGVLDAETFPEWEKEDPLSMCASALPPDFTREQVALLRNLAMEHVPYEVASFDEKEFWMHNYLLEKKLLMEATPGVHSPFGWIRQAVAEDWK